MAAKMLPIQSELKSSRIFWAKETGPLEWAYTKMIRETNRTKKIYDVDPYAEVYQFRDNMYGIFSENADGHTDQWSYLVVGPEKAMLIDNGFGIGNIRALAEEISGKEVIMANTHASYDHSYGNFWFDRAYVQEFDAPLMEAQRNPHIWDYLFDENGKNIWLQFDREDLPKFHEYEIVPCKDHTVFDLGGGYKVEMIWMPGHQAGHAFFLDYQNRILFTGDGLESGTTAITGVSKKGDTYGPKYINVQSLQKQFKLLVEEHLDDIDTIFPGHGILDIESRVLPDVLKALDKILADPENPTRRKVKEKDGKVKAEYFMEVPGFTELKYNPKNILPKEE